MSRLIHYGVRLTAEQMKYLKDVPNAGKFIRDAVTEKIKKENRFITVR